MFHLAPGPDEIGGRRAAISGRRFRAVAMATKRSKWIKVDRSGSSRFFIPGPNLMGSFLSRCDWVRDLVHSVRSAQRLENYIPVQLLRALHSATRRAVDLISIDTATTNMSGTLCSRPYGPSPPPSTWPLDHIPGTILDVIVHCIEEDAVDLHSCAKCPDCLWVIKPVGPIYTPMSLEF